MPIQEDLIRRRLVPTGLTYCLGGAEEAFIMGDFNFGDGGGNSILPADFSDAWPALHPNADGCTFDCTKNTLAALTTVSSHHKRDTISFAKLC